MASLTIMICFPSWRALRSVAIGSCRLIWSHSGRSHVAGGVVIRWYNVCSGGGIAGSAACIGVMGSEMAMDCLRSVGVTGIVSAGMLARGVLLLLYTQVLRRCRGVRYSYHT